VSFDSLLNKSVIHWRRSIESRDQFNEITYSSELVSTELAVNIQDLNFEERQYIEPGNFAIQIKQIFARFSADIRIGDFLVCSDSLSYEVVNVINADGMDHHKEIIVKYTKQI